MRLGCIEPGKGDTILIMRGLCSLSVVIVTVPPLSHNTFPYILIHPNNTTSNPSLYPPLLTSPIIHPPHRVTPDGYIVERSHAITNVIANIAAAANAARTGKKSTHSSSSSVSSVPPAEKQAKLDEHIGPVAVDYHMVLEETSKVIYPLNPSSQPTINIIKILSNLPH